MTAHAIPRAKARRHKVPVLSGPFTLLVAAVAAAAALISYLLWPTWPGDPGKTAAPRRAARTTRSGVFVAGFVAAGRSCRERYHSRQSPNRRGERDRRTRTGRKRPAVRDHHRTGGHAAAARAPAHDLSEVCRGAGVRRPGRACYCAVPRRHTL